MLDRLIRNIWNGLPKLEPLLFPVQRSPVHSIAIVLMLVAIAFAVRQMIGPPELGVPFLTFFPAAAISAVFGGFWAGMLATALGSVTATYFFIPPYSAFSFEFRSETVFGNLVYLLDEIVVCSAIAALHRFYRITKDQNVKLNTLIQAIPDLIWLKTPEGVYRECNPAVERFFGWIEGSKKITPRHEILEHSYLCLVTLSCIVMP
jgi:K+-sensing histidine kinase KdpD